MVRLLLTALLTATASAAPAIVWKGGINSPPSGPSHISHAIDTNSLLSSLNTNNENSAALSAVIFLVGRNADGSEGLSTLASSGKIPGVQEKHRLAHEVHHHVQGVESTRTVAKDAQRNLGNVAEVTMEEFTNKLSSIAQTEASVEGGDVKITKAEQKRRRAISEADVLVVNVGVNEDASKIDAAIVAAIDSSSVKNVVLSTIRSTAEVKHARKLAVMDKRSAPKKTKSNTATNSNGSYNGNGRRLEDEGNNENNQNNNNNNQDEEGIYYVNMTPNIFAGLLFFFMFVFTAHLGLTCMNMIEGQDVYVKKMPAIGREV